MRDLPVVCTLDPAALEARRKGLLAELFRHAVAHDELPNGHRLRFEAAADTLALVTSAIDAERQCCRFLRFQLTVAPDAGPIVLEVTGPRGTREFLSALAAGE